MKKRYIYFLVGALLCGFVIVTFQISRAADAYPNPGHALTCHIVTGSDTYVSYAQCDYGIVTGGGCVSNNATYHVMYNYPHGANGWSCISSGQVGITTYAVCCEAG